MTGDGRVPPMPEPTDRWRITAKREQVGYTIEVGEDGSGLRAETWALTGRGARRKAARYIRGVRRDRARRVERFTVAPEDTV